MSVSGNDGRQREAHSPMGILGLVAGGQYAFLLIRALGFPVTYLITAAPPEQAMTTGPVQRSVGSARR
jgi:hypothetical protein